MVLSSLASEVKTSVMHKEAADAFERMPEMVAEMEKYREEST